MIAQDTKPKESTLKNEPIEVLPVRELRVLLSWKAPVRVFKKRDKEFWSTIFAIAFLLTVILFFIQEWLLIAAIVALIFVYYVLSTVPPEEIENQITNRGVRFAGKEYLWEEIWGYWISERWGQKILNFGLRARIPGRLELLLGETEEKKVKETLSKYLSEEPPQASFLDKASDWLSKKVPLDINK